MANGRRQSSLDEFFADPADAFGRGWTVDIDREDPDAVRVSGPYDATLIPVFRRHGGWWNRYARRREFPDPEKAIGLPDAIRRAATRRIRGRLAEPVQERNVARRRGDIERLVRRIVREAYRDPGRSHDAARIRRLRQILSRDPQLERKFRDRLLHLEGDNRRSEEIRRKYAGARSFSCELEPGGHPMVGTVEKTPFPAGEGIVVAWTWRGVDEPDDRADHDPEWSGRSPRRVHGVGVLLFPRRGGRDRT